MYRRPIKIVFDDEEENLPNVSIYPKDRVKIIILDDDDDLKTRKREKCVIPKCKCVSNERDMCKKHCKQYHFEKPEECPVCLESLKEEKYPLLECGHWVHHDCVVNSGKAECPCCRASVKLNKTQRSALKKIHDKFKRDKEEEERREIRQQLELERSIISRNTNWIDNRETTSFFINRRGSTSDRIREYMNSDERASTITILQDIMTSPHTTLRNDATVLFELQSALQTIQNSELNVSRRMFNIFTGLVGVIEQEIRGVVLENI